MLGQPQAQNMANLVQSSGRTAAELQQIITVCLCFCPMSDFYGAQQRRR